MYSVSEEYMQAVSRLYRKSALRAEIVKPDGTEMHITHEYIRKCSIKSQCVSNNSFDIGSVCSSELNISLKYDLGSDILGTSFFIEYGIEISDNVYEWIPLGKYYVTKINKGNVSDITACDIISFIDDSDDAENPVSRQLAESMQAYDILQIICSYAGVICGNTREEIEAMMNGKLYTYVPETSITSTRDMLSYLSQWLGGFIAADRNGRLLVKRHGRFQEPVAEIPLTAIKSGSYKCSDFQLIISGALIKLNEDGSVWSKMLCDEEGRPNSKILDVTGNPFFMGYYYLNGGKDSEKMYEPLYGVAEQCINVKWVPLSANYPGGNPALDAGDSIKINGKITTISHSVWNFHGSHTISCCGEDSRILKGLRTQNKRTAEITDKKVSNAKGINVTQSEFDNLKASGRLVEDAVYNIIE